LYTGHLPICAELVYSAGSVTLLVSGKVVPVNMTASTSTPRQRRRGEGSPRLLFRLLVTVPYLVAFLLAPRLIGVRFTLVGSYIFLIMTLPVLYLMIWVHELGHVVAGLAVGFQFVFLSVGPVQLRLKNGKLRLSMVRRKGFRGGMAGAYPASAEDLPRRYLIYAAGGPLGGLGFAAASYAAFTLVPLQSMWWRAILTFAALEGLFASLLNLIPLRYAGLRMDGAYLLSALRGDERDRNLFAHLALIAAILKGIRPRDWDPSLVMRSPSPGQRGMDILYIDLMKCYYAWDRGEIAEAGTCFERVMEREDDYPLVNRKALYYEAAYFWARHRGDTVQATRWMSSKGTEIIPEGYYQPALDAAIAYADGIPEIAVERARQAIDLLEESPFLGTAKMMRDDLEHLIAEARTLQVEPGRGAA
jgi:hypothetical protein